MREIKFRCWHKELNRMLTNEELQERTEYTAGLPNSICIINNGKTIYMQYTGIKDDKEREIYEGDIVEVTKSYTDIKSFKQKGEIIFKDGLFIVKYDDKKYDMSMTEDLLIIAKDCFDGIRVIGNKFEVVKGTIK